MLNSIDFKHKKWISALSYALFIIYIIVAVILLFLSPYRQAAYEINSSGSNPYNIIPFKTITDYIKASSHINQSIWMSNLFGNVLAFFPLGIFLPWLFKSSIGFWRTISFVFLATSTVEILQFATRVGSFDIDDIILNTTGGVLGYLVIKIIYLMLLKGKTNEH
jgi:glycopeptide antibiotics resistance protein